jgi:hypothetical protein
MVLIPVNPPYTIRLASLLALKFDAEVGSIDPIAHQAGQAVDIINFLTRDSHTSPFSEVELDQFQKIYRELLSESGSRRKYAAKFIKLLLIILTNNLLTGLPPESTNK